MPNATADKLFDLASPAAQRNIAPLVEAVLPRLPQSGLVVEIAAGHGYHSAVLAAETPALTWQPTDVDSDALGRISHLVQSAALSNLRPPVALDTEDVVWAVDSATVFLCCNMIHIAPWSAAIGLFAGVGRVLSDGGMLFLYGPFKVDGAHTAPSNESFEEWLKSEDESWGVRDTADVDALAHEAGLRLAQYIAMPANNMLRVYQRAG